MVGSVPHHPALRLLLRSRLAPLPKQADLIGVNHFPLRFGAVFRLVFPLLTIAADGNLLAFVNAAINGRLCHLVQRVDTVIDRGFRLTLSLPPYMFGEQELDAGFARGCGVGPGIGCDIAPEIAHAQSFRFRIGNCPCLTSRDVVCHWRAWGERRARGWVFSLCCSVTSAPRNAGTGGGDDLSVLDNAIGSGGIGSVRGGYRKDLNGDMTVFQKEGMGRAIFRLDEHTVFRKLWGENITETHLNIWRGDCDRVGLRVEVEKARDLREAERKPVTVNAVTDCFGRVLHLQRKLFKCPGSGTGKVLVSVFHIWGQGI